LKWTRSFLLIAFGVFALNFNQGVVFSVQTNFFRQELGIVGLQMGYFTATREFIGFMMVLVAAATVGFRVSRVAGAALLVCAVGYFSYSRVNSFPQLLVAALIGSLGFHTWFQVYYVLGLSLADEGYEGRVLGRLASIGSVGMLIAMVITLAIVGVVGMRNMFVLSASVVALGGIGLFFVPHNPRLVRQQGFVFKRRYWLYYVLQFLDGCRMEIFMTFALFVLVDVYGVSVQNITLLLIINGVLNWIAAPIFGGWIDHHGERVVLTVTYAAHLAVCLTFALVPNAVVVAAMYIMYRTFSMATVATNTYLKKIALPADVSPSLAMGVTMNHVAAIIVPITAGVLWQAFGYAISFFLAAAFVAMSLVATQLMRTPTLAAAAVSGGRL